MSSVPHTLSTSGQAVTSTLSAQTSHSVSMESVTTSCLTSAGLIPSVTNSSLIVASTDQHLTTTSPLSTDQQLTITASSSAPVTSTSCMSLDNRGVLASSVSEPCTTTNTAQTLADAVEAELSASERVCSMSPISTEHSDSHSMMSEQQHTEADSEVLPEDSVVNTEDSVEKPEDSVEKPEDSVVNTEDSVVNTEDSVVYTEDSVVYTEDSVVKPEDSVEKPEDSVEKPEDSVVKPEDSVVNTDTTAREVLPEETGSTVNTNRTGTTGEHELKQRSSDQLGDDDDDDGGVVPAESGDSEGVEGAKNVRVKEQPLRQVITLPSALLSLINPSLPISLSLRQCHQELTVPASHVYQSTSGLRLLLPPDSLPAEYVGAGKQLACTLGRSDDVRQSQLISLSLTLH